MSGTATYGRPSMGSRLLAHVAGCSALPCPAGQQVEAFSWGDLNPLKWLGKGASAVVGDAWKAAMTALWSAGLWLLELAFKIIDAFTTPDLSTGGPLAEVYPYTFGIGLAVASVMALVQVGTAALRRDGRAVARVLVGLAQFGAVWVGYVGCAAAGVIAASGLTRGLLQGLLGIGAFSGWGSVSNSWPRQVDDVVVATVLGLSTVFLIFPAAIGYLLIMLVREAALMLIAATSAIAAGGLLAEGTRAWFWRTLRWFLAALLMAPLCALVLGIGVRITHGIVRGEGDATAASVGMAVVGCVLILLGAVCPLVLFKLLAFVDPGTTSGAAMRESFAAHGGIAGLVSGRNGGGRTAGSGVSARSDGYGRSAGEATADAQTSGRVAQALRGVGEAAGTAATVAGKVGTKAAAVSADVLASAGVGHHAPYFGQHEPSRNGSTHPPRSQRDDRPAQPATESWGTPPPPPDHGPDVWGDATQEPPRPAVPPSPPPPVRPDAVRPSPPPDGDGAERPATDGGTS
jgi:type IV secretion system protein TrbL